MSPLLRIGCAGWSLPRAYWPAFAEQGTHLQRYASRLPAVEINSSFYRPHQPATYARWAHAVPPGFAFSVKVPKQITHVQRLHDCAGLLDAFVQQCTQLGERLGCLLVQTPPSLACEPQVAQAFFGALRERYAGAVAFEPRHASWADAGALLERWRIAQVGPTPAPSVPCSQVAGPACAIGACTARHASITAPMGTNAWHCWPRTYARPCRPAWSAGASSTTPPAALR